MDTNVLTSTTVSGKLNASAIGDKSLDGNFKTLKVMDTPVITDLSGKLSKSGDTMTGTLTLASTGLAADGTTYSAATLKSKLEGDYMTRGGTQTLTANITSGSSDTYTFMGAKSSEIAYVSGTK